MPRYQSPYDPASAPKKLEHLLYEKKGHVAYVTINRPEVRNALHSYAYVELRSCWRDIGLDPNIYCGIVTGTGEAFCAGRDVKFLAQHQSKGLRTPHEDPNSPIFHWGGGGQPSDVNLDKPLIAAYLTLCNGRLSAQRCYQLGIVNEVAPRERLITEAEKLADMICMGSPLATQAAVRIYRMSTAFPSAVVEYARHLDKETAESDDGAEGPRAFREKRKPNWKLR